MKTLEVYEISKRYYSRGKAIEAVRDVSLTLSAGEVLAFLGPNGAGKTTTIKMIAGLIFPDSGKVKITESDPHRNPLTLRQVGAVLEGNRNLYWRLTPEENLEYFGVLRGLRRKVVRRRVHQLLERFDLTDKRRTPVEKLSRGMQQKLAIAIALIHEPKLLLLDEPTLGLDIEATQKVKLLVREIAQEGHAILLTTHQLDIAEELSDRVMIINQGKIITQAPTQKLIRGFSGTAYTIEIDGELDLKRKGAIQNLDAAIKGNSIIYVRGTEAMYKVLEILAPIPLMRVEKEGGSLTEVFLKLIQEKYHD